MYDHHDARYNLELISQDLTLIEDHYKGNGCADCLVKHISTIRAYSREALGLNNARNFIELLKKIDEVMDKHLQIILGCAVGEKCDINDKDDMDKLVQEIRALRKEIVENIYNVSELDKDHHYIHHDEEEHIHLEHD